MCPQVWMFCWFLCVLWCVRISSSSSRQRRQMEAPDPQRQQQCSYTFLIPEQKITGPICASRGPSLPDPERVTRTDMSELRQTLSRQRREMETLRMMVDVDGDMVQEMKLLRKESRNMNSRVTQLYMQLLHEVLRKRDSSLELAALQNRLLNGSAAALRLSAGYRELQQRVSVLAERVNSQAELLALLEERCVRVYGRQSRDPPSLPQVLPENIPVFVPRVSNEIQSNSWTEEQRPGAAAADTGERPAQNNSSLKGPFRDCYAALQAGHSVSGAILLQPDDTLTPVQAWCEHDVDRGGWTLIQRRKDGAVNFSRDWDSYKLGFGDVDGEHWLGLDTIYSLGRQEEYKLLVEMEDWMEKKVYAAYSSFHLEPESQSYRLRLGLYQGNAGDSLTSHNGRQFTTLDRDHDAFSGNCAHFQKGGWWYNACGQTNLNGVWYSGGVYRSRFQDGIFWADYGGGFYSMKSVRMMIRPID
ncbi:angiopoietin-related protein 1b precursor [Danio rerio]|uniref:Angiopoietin-related protein 1b precursor n=2 Tax=Danio rerio TaxID=7955 RepID=A0A8M1NV56_DANRE|nr:angiopoietin-related protein 1b precursor [Danio rerio]|eukprot:NP_001186899.1 angiopoietin-like 1b precursor [Danio rerio]